MSPMSGSTTPNYTSYSGQHFATCESCAEYPTTIL